MYHHALYSVCAFRRVLVFAGFFLPVVLSAQPWSYDFGTGTGTANNSNAGSGSTSFFAGTPSGGGTYRVRIGTGSGSVILANSGTSLGTGTESQLTAATGTSTNKFGVYDWSSPSTVAYVKFKIRTTSSGNGNLNISIGINTLVSDNVGFTSQYNNSLASLRINYASGAVSSVQRRTSGADNTISSPGLSKDADQEVIMYLNNGSSSTSYTVSGTSYTINSQQWDLWVDGTKISPANGWAKAGTLAAATNISGFAFFAESSTSNAAVMYIDDLEYSNTLPSVANPTLTSPTAATITDVSASLGATISSDGGAGITARGTAYKTTTGVTSSDNAAAEGGTSTGTFSHSRTGLTPQTLYYYAGYATNSNGTGLSSEGSFRTLSSSPTAQASGLVANPASSTQVDVSFNTATFPASGATKAGYVVIYSTGTPSLGSTNGQAPAAGTGTIFSTSASTLPATPATSLSITGLSPATSYNMLVVPFTWDGTNAATYNYLTASAPTGSATTSAGVPTLSLPTATSITDVSATLGATITSNGGVTLSARGTVYKTSSGVTSGDNAAAEGNTTVASFTHSRTGLSAQTQYYYAGYATNSSGTSLSAEGNFRTLSSAPTGQAATVSTSNPTGNTLDLTIGTAATFPASGATQAGYVIIYSTGTPSLGSSNGQAPAAGVGTIFSTTATTLPATPPTALTITGLAGSTTYNILVVPYTWDGTNTATYNYLTTSAATASGTTTLPTYTWAGANNSSWATSTNWTPTRTSPATNDILIFNTNTTLTITSVPTQTLGRIQVNGSSTKITLQAASANSVLTVGNLTGTDLVVDAGCELNISGSNALSIVPASGATGSVSGSMKFTQAAHSLVPTDANAITFNSGSSFTAGDLGSTGFTGNVFGAASGTVYNGVVFASGSTFTQNEGSNPFAITQPNSRVQFQSGSNFVFALASGTPSVSGRTYGNLEVNTTNATAINMTGAATLTINGNLVVTSCSGGFNLNLTGGITITGNISVASGQTLGFSPASANTITLSGTTQNISGSGTLTIGSNASLSVGGSTTVNLQRALAPANNTTVASGGLFNVASGGNLTVNSVAVTGTGAFTLSGGGTLTTNNASGVDGVITATGTKTFSNTANYVFNGATTAPFGTQVSTVTANNMTINANVTLDKTCSVNGILTLTSGTFATGGSLTLSSTGSIIYAGGSISGFTLPATVSSYTPTSGTTTLSTDLTVTGTLALGNNTLELGGNTLNINGDFTVGTGVIKSSGSGSINIGGTGSLTNSIILDQTTPGTTNRVASITMNRGISAGSGSATLGNPIQVTGTVTLSNGTLNTGGNLTLVSDASATARIGEIPATADIWGSVKVQRYVPAVVRRYRGVSPGTSSFTYADIIDNIYVSGTGGASNGFDATTSNASTIYTYQESTTGGRGWKAISAISNTLSPGQGSLVFIRGDRTLASPAWYTSGSFPAQNAVTMDFNGSVNKGSVSPTITYTNTGDPTGDGWNLVGNPYPSQIDWTLVTKTNLASNYYTLDPATGSYVANSGTNFIASGQAFFVQATAAAPVITFTESCKTASSSTNYFKAGTQRISMVMALDSVNSDMAQVEFNSSSTLRYHHAEDAIKLSNPLINFGILVNNDSIKVQISRRPMPATATDTIRLFATAPAGAYMLRFSDQPTVNGNYALFLWDRFLNNMQDIRLNPEYPFVITADPSSSGNQRFCILMSNPSALPVELMGFSGSRRGCDVVLGWQTAFEHKVTSFTIERSWEAENEFHEIGAVAATGKSDGHTVTNYLFTDHHAITETVGTLYYRLKQTDRDGTTEYSPVVVVKKEWKKDNINVFPNPASRDITLNVASEIQGNLRVDVYNLVGKLCLSQDIFVSKGKEAELSVSSLKGGAYIIKLLHPINGTLALGKFVKE